MKMISPNAQHEVMAKAGTNCRWNEVGSEQAQEAVKDPIRFGFEFTRFLQNSGRVTVVTTDGIIPPPGGMIHILSVPVDESRPWPDVIRAAAPNTGSDWDIWKVWDQYPPVAGARLSIKQVILANFGKVAQSEEALAWGKEQKLKPTMPRACFAISEHFPKINRYLDMNPMAVVTLMDCSFVGCRRVPSVWLCGAEREAFLRRFVIDWGGLYWFAFVRE